MKYEKYYEKFDVKGNAVMLNFPVLRISSEECAQFSVSFMTCICLFLCHSIYMMVLCVNK